MQARGRKDRKGLPEKGGVKNSAFEGEAKIPSPLIQQNISGHDLHDSGPLGMMLELGGGCITLLGLLNVALIV